MLLRDHAFISASHYNRSCFLQQVTRIFHSGPYYRVLSALDYHQCINLICPDFPRTLILDACSILDVHPSATENPIQQGEVWSVISHEPRLFDRFGLEDLKAAVELVFYYTEFIEKLKTCFAEFSPPFSVQGEAAISLIYSSVSSAYSRNKNSWLEYPPLDIVFEALLQKHPNPPTAILTQSEVPAALNSAASISFKELCQNMLKNSKLQVSIFGEPSPPDQQEALVQLSKEDL